MKQLTQDNNPSSQFTQTYWSSRIQLIIPYNCTTTTVMSQWCIVMCLTHCSWKCPLLSSFNRPVLPCLPCMFSMLQCASLIWWYRRAMEFLNVSRIHHFRILNVSENFMAILLFIIAKKAVEISVSPAVPHVWLKDSVGDRWKWHKMSLLLKHPHCWKS